MTENEQKVPERDHTQRSIAIPCPSCEAFVETRLGPASEVTRLPDALSCASCSANIDLPHPEQLHDGHELDGCPACGYHTLCIQKDVNPRFGVILVVVTFGTLLLLRPPIPWLVAGLVALTVIDVVLLRLGWDPEALPFDVDRFVSGLLAALPE